MKTPSFDQIVAVALAHMWQFVFVFFLIFTLLYGFLVAIDFVPEAPTPTDESEADTSIANILPAFDPFTSAEAATETVVLPDLVEAPRSITIPSLNRTVAVVPAASNSLTDLDTALLSGVVRHPDSAKLGEEGNVVILGHSSYLPNVLNRNFQALNGSQNLVWGDTITVDSDTTRYTYIVRDVYKVKASAAVIPTEGVGKRLTLVTCNSFATADDRFIIEAELLSSTPLS